MSVLDEAVRGLGPVSHVSERYAATTHSAVMPRAAFAEASAGRAPLWAPA